MILTGTQLIYRALRLIGQLRAGFGGSSDDLADGLATLNDILDTWSTDRLFCFTINDATYTFASTKQSYSIGPTATDFVAPRPNKIETANIILTGTGNPPTRIPVQIVDSLDWSGIAVPATPASVPLGMYNDGQNPNSNLYFWPMPTVGYQLELFTWTALSQFADLTTSYNFPPGYSEAIKYALAVALAPQFAKGLDDRKLALVREKAIETQRRIESLNAPSPVMSCDAPGCSTTNGYYNYLTGLPI